MACRPYNTGRCLLLRLFNCPNFWVHFSDWPRVRIDGEAQQHVAAVQATATDAPRHGTVENAAVL